MFLTLIMALNSLVTQDFVIILLVLHFHENIKKIPASLITGN